MRDLPRRYFLVALTPAERAYLLDLARAALPDHVAAACVLGLERSVAYARAADGVLQRVPTHGDLGPLPDEPFADGAE